jgi:hypothetical protein
MVQRVLWNCILPAISSRASASCHTAPTARARAGARRKPVHRAILHRPDHHRSSAESLHLLPSPVLQPPQALGALAPMCQTANQKRGMTKPFPRHGDAFAMGLTSCRRSPGPLTRPVRRAPRGIGRKYHILLRAPTINYVREGCRGLSNACITLFLGIPARYFGKAQYRGGLGESW